jgi:hypothetical protein
VQPIAGKIVDFDMKPEGYNGAFQYTTSRDRSWIHCDKGHNWAGVLYLTPQAPLSAGTAFYRHKEFGDQVPGEIASRDSLDYSKWDCVDRVGNVYNRLLLFRSVHFHQSMDYFGTDLHNGRLFQVFFFSTEQP